MYALCCTQPFECAEQCGFYLEDPWNVVWAVVPSDTGMSPQ